jgi:hypothetical protein
MKDLIYMKDQEIQRLMEQVEFLKDKVQKHAKALETLLHSKQ